MKRKIILISSVIIITILIIIIVLISKDNNGSNNIQQNIQSINLKEEKVSETMIDNGLLLDNTNIECNENACTITMTAKNQTGNSIDMSNYRISFMNSNNVEVYWFSGVAIGKVDANGEQIIALQVPKTVSDANKIVYTKN